MDKEHLKNYLITVEKQTADGKTMKSPYAAVLIDARGVTGRDINTGEKINSERCGCWLGAVGYAIAIDHIGDRFFHKADEKRKKSLEDKLKNKKAYSSFAKALIYFSSLSLEQILALYALRCSFVHDYFLFNNRNRFLNYHFSVCRGGDGELINFSQDWDGNLDTRADNNKTKVNIELLGDLVETIHQKLLSLLDDDKLKTVNGANFDFIEY